jgi:hypothetical protein
MRYWINCNKFSGPLLCLMATRSCQGGRRSLRLLLRGRRRTSRAVHRPPRPSKQRHVPQAPPTKRQAAGSLPMIPATKRPIPIWMGPMRAAARWGKLGAESRELAQLRYGNMVRPDREVHTFRLPAIRLRQSDSLEMEVITEKRLRGRVWRELSPQEGRKESYVSREFIARNSNGSDRSLAILSHFPDHFDAGRSLALDEFAEWISSLSAPPGYAEVFYCVNGNGRWNRKLCSVSCASFLVEPLWLLVYSTSPALLGNGEEEPRLSCAKLCGRFCDCPLAGKGDCSPLSQGIEAPRPVSTKVRADATCYKQYTRGIKIDTETVLQTVHSHFQNRY